MSTQKEFLLFFIAVLVSLTLHLLIIFNIYHPGNMVVMPLTIGMVFGWLYSSATIKDYITANKTSFKKILQNTPALLKYMLGFTLLYSFASFFYTLSLQPGDGWVDFHLNYNKLRGVSGFWVLFYLIGFSGAYLKYRVFENRHIKD